MLKNKLICDCLRDSEFEMPVIAFLEKILSKKIQK